jgi:Fic family protein
MWQPINDLPSDLVSFSSSELTALVSIWKEQRQRLTNSRALQLFEKKMAREWAIETGVIENLYSIDRGVTQLLIERGIEASLIPHGATNRPVSEVVAILKDQQDTLEGLFDFVTNRRNLSTSYIKELHQSLTRNQPTTEAVDQIGRSVEVELLRGEWKKQPNNPTRPNGNLHFYCPPEHVSAEMDQLILIHEQHNKNNVSPEVMAAWLHHRFTQIHPFQDGNGRVARALASIILLKHGWFPLVINRDFRDLYIDSLENADDGNLTPLINLICEEQKKALVKALSLSEDALRQEQPLSRVIQLAKDRLEGRTAIQSAKRLDESEKRARHLLQVCNNELSELRDSLKTALQSTSTEFRATVRSNDSNNDFWFKHQIITVAQKLDYFADTRTYRAWCSLRIADEAQTDFVFAFHALGSSFTGLMAASAFLQPRNKSISLGDQGSVEVYSEPTPITSSVFQFSHLETIPVIEDRFRNWMKDALIIGLDTWQRQL